MATEKAEAGFSQGDVVAWPSKNELSGERVGIVVEVVKAERLPKKYEAETTVGRKHVSYVVEVTDGNRFWPVVSKLRVVAKKPVNSPQTIKPRGSGRGRASAAGPGKRRNEAQTPQTIDLMDKLKSSLKAKGEKLKAEVKQIIDDAIPKSGSVEVFAKLDRELVANVDRVVALGDSEGVRREVEAADAAGMLVEVPGPAGEAVVETLATKRNNAVAVDVVALRGAMSIFQRLFRSGGRLVMIEADNANLWLRGQSNGVYVEATVPLAIWVGRPKFSAHVDANDLRVAAESPKLGEHAWLGLDGPVKVYIEGGGVEFILPTSVPDPHDWPKLHNCIHRVDYPGDQWNECASFAEMAVSADPVKPHLHGVHVYNQTFAATDGHRLHVCHGSKHFPSGMAVTIPRSALVLSQLFDRDVLFYHYASNWLAMRSMVEGAVVNIMAKRLDALNGFPRVTSVIPQHTDRVLLDLAELREALSSVIKSKCETVGIVASRGRSALVGMDGGSAFVTIPIRGGAEPDKILLCAVRPEYLREAIAGCETPWVEFRMGGILDPVAINLTAKRAAVIMPQRSPRADGAFPYDVDAFINAANAPAWDERRWAPSVKPEPEPPAHSVSVDLELRAALEPIVARLGNLALEYPGVVGSTIALAMSQLRRLTNPRSGQRPPKEPKAPKPPRTLEERKEAAKRAVETRRRNREAKSAQEATNPT